MELSGIEIIDDQHMWLLSIIQDLRSVFASGGDRAKIIEIIGELQRYAHVHFKTEETVMRRFDYFDYHNHVDVHSDFIDMLEDAVDNIEKSSIVVEKTISFLESWIEHHIDVEAELFKDVLGDSGSVDRIE